MAQVAGVVRVDRLAPLAALAPPALRRLGRRRATLAVQQVAHRIDRAGLRAAVADRVLAGRLSTTYAWPPARRGTRACAARTGPDRYGGGSPPPLPRAGAAPRARPRPPAPGGARRAPRPARRRRRTARPNAASSSAAASVPRSIQPWSMTTKRPWAAPRRPPRRPRPPPPATRPRWRARRCRAPARSAPRRRAGSLRHHDLFDAAALGPDELGGVALPIARHLLVLDGDLRLHLALDHLVEQHRCAPCARGTNPASVPLCEGDGELLVALDAEALLGVVRGAVELGRGRPRSGAGGRGRAPAARRTAPAS